ncbi:MAG TPA: hypothetical protein VMF62_02435 [Acetobacteraceae bacterium]|nr:hypothetical protein [Acetobacteraceae bacterium]
MGPMRAANLFAARLVEEDRIGGLRRSRSRCSARSHGRAKAAAPTRP